MNSIYLRRLKSSDKHSLRITLEDDHLMKFGVYNGENVILIKMRTTINNAIKLYIL